MTISEKVAYLKGLADGLDLDQETSKEGKLIAKIIDVLEDVGFAQPVFRSADFAVALLPGARTLSSCSAQDIHPSGYRS